MPESPRPAVRSDRGYVQELEAHVDCRITRVSGEFRGLDFHGVLRGQRVDPRGLHHSDPQAIDARLPELVDSGSASGWREFPFQVRAEPEIDLVTGARRAKATAAPTRVVFVHNL
jgi:hypothetical protein